MSTAEITFHTLIQRSQGVSDAPNNNHMISIAQFVLQIDGGLIGAMSVEMRQPFGTGIEEQIEVGPPVTETGPYAGNWNQNEFHSAAESYYRALIGGQGSAMNVAHAKSARMQDNVFRANVIHSFDIPDGRRERIEPMRFENLAFDNKWIMLDGREHVGCTFTRCMLVFGGGTGLFEGNTLRESDFFLAGPALRTVQFVASVQQARQAPAA